MSSTPSPTEQIGHYRYRILALLFVATTINYMDRSVLGVLGPTLQYKVFHWTDQQYGDINAAFNLAYAIGMLSMGAVIDKLGTKIGYALSIGIWSIFGMLHATVRPAFGFIGFCAARFGLGIGESGNFPAAIKTVAEWFPKRERAFATGLFNAGSNVGAVLAPIVIPLIVWPDGTHWQYAFLTTGIFSAIWVVLWLKIYRRPEVHPRLTTAERDYIESDSKIETLEKVPWRRLVPKKETWAFATLKLTDAVWWFYLFWAAKFLYDQFGLSIKALALPLIMIYVIADLGSVAGGWMSSALIKHGWPVNRARKVTMLTFACCILPVMFSTKMGTRFNVNEAFFQKLQTATFSTEKIVVVDGRRTTERVSETVPAGVQAALHQLDGKSYGAARDFLNAVEHVIPLAEAQRVENALYNSARSNNLYWLAVLLIAIAAGSHQAWSANVFTIVSDVFPKKATASVTGIGGMVGAAAGIFANLTMGDVLTTAGPAGYFYAFLVAGLMYLVVLAIAHVLTPNLTPLDENLQRVV